MKLDTGNKSYHIPLRLLDPGLICSENFLYPHRHIADDYSVSDFGELVVIIERTLDAAFTQPFKCEQSMWQSLDLDQTTLWVASSITYRNYQTSEHPKTWK